MGWDNPLVSQALLSCVSSQPLAHPQPSSLCGAGKKQGFPLLSSTKTLLCYHTGSATNAKHNTIQAAPKKATCPNTNLIENTAISLKKNTYISKQSQKSAGKFAAFCDTNILNQDNQGTKIFLRCLNAF